MFSLHRPSQKAKSLSPDVESAFVGRSNDDGKTALQISLQKRARRISWTLIQKGGARNSGPRSRISSNSLLQVGTMKIVRDMYEL